MGEIRLGGSVDPRAACLSRVAVKQHELPSWSQIRSSAQYTHVEGAFGWPFRCMGWYVIRDGAVTGIPIEKSRNLEIVRASNRGVRVSWEDRVPYRIVPVMPIVVGSIGNGLVYGTALFVFVAILSYLLKQYRSKRRCSLGKCAQCGYSLDGLREYVCPECGKRI